MSDNSEFSPYNNDNILANVNLFQGNAIKGMTFSISSLFNKTNRLNIEDFKSSNHDVIIGFGMNKGVNLTLVGSIDEYDTGAIPASFGESNLDSNSYGVGFEWTPANNRSLLFDCKTFL